MSEQSFEDLIEKLAKFVSPDGQSLISQLQERHQRQSKRLNNVLQQREKLKEDIKILKNEIETLNLTPASEADSFSHLNILIAEDDESNQMILEEQFRQLGVQFTIVDNGQAAMDFLNNNPETDMVFTDWQMPVMDGIAFANQARADKRQLPIIMFTANRSEEETNFALSNGIDVVIHKPLKIDEVRAVIKEMQASAPASWIDLAAFKEIMGTDNPEVIKPLLVSFLESANDVFVEMEEALAQQDNSALKSLCHRLEGSAASAGAKVLENATESLHQLLNSEADPFEIQLAFDDCVSIKFETENYIKETLNN